LLAKAAGQLASILNVPPSSRASPLPHWVVANTASATAPNPCGSELARDEIYAVQTKTSHPHRRQTLLLQTPPTPHHQPTHPCAFAYNYARIRPLVRLVPGFYCFPATAHQWSGLVARLRIRSHESHQSGIARTRWWLCAWRLRARRVFRCPTGLLTCAQLPPFRLVARR